MGGISDEDVLTFASAADWEAWLQANGSRCRGAWLVIARKGRRVPGLTIDEALDAALCHGWIDSHRRARDADTFLQRYSPRRRRSPWSRLNVERAEALIRAGRMRASGAAELAAAQAEGRWTAGQGRCVRWSP
jgi:uncharacterized protein YdeI (YjbR/CyaY-like superfamily)